MEQFSNLQYDRLKHLIKQRLDGFLVPQIDRAEKLFEFTGHMIQHIKKLFVGHAAHMPHQVSLALQLLEDRQKPASVGYQACDKGDHAAILQGQHAVRDVEDAVVMGHHQNGAALPFGELVQQFDDLPASLPIKRGGWLISKHNLGMTDQSSRDSHPLPLAARNCEG